MKIVIAMTIILMNIILTITSTVCHKEKVSELSLVVSAKRVIAKPLVSISYRINRIGTSLSKPKGVILLYIDKNEIIFA